MPILETLIVRILGDTTSGAMKAGWSRLRRKRATPAAAHDPTIDDFLTGAGQAVMAARAAVEHFERYDVLIELDTYELEEGSAGILDEARRTADEAEARLPRVQVRVGVDAPLARASEATVASLRAVVEHLRDYTEQPSEGKDWDMAPLNKAKVALGNAVSSQRAALRAASKLKR